MPRLTKRQRTNLIRDYIEGGGAVNQTTLAKKYNVSPKTVSVTLSSPEVQALVKKEKAESEKSMLLYLESKRGEVEGLLSKILTKIDGKLDEDKVPLRDYVGAWKILTESYSSKTEQTDGSAEGKSMEIAFIIKDTSGVNNGDSNT